MFGRREPQVSPGPLQFPNFLNSIHISKEFKSSSRHSSPKNNHKSNGSNSSRSCSPTPASESFSSVNEVHGGTLPSSPPTLSSPLGIVNLEQTSFATPCKKSESQTSLSSGSNSMPPPMPITPESSKTSTDNTTITPTISNSKGGVYTHSGNRWSNLRNKTAVKLRAAVERSRQAELLGHDRSRHKHQTLTLQKREQNLRTGSAASATSSISGHSRHSLNDDPVYTNPEDYGLLTDDIPLSSCDAIDRGSFHDGGGISKAGGSLHREQQTLAGMVMSAARKVDRKHAEERNRAIEATISDRVALSAAAEAARRSSKTFPSHHVPFADYPSSSSSGSKEKEKGVEGGGSSCADGSEKGNGGDMSAMPFSEVKKRMNRLRKENRTLVSEREHLQRQLNKERQESLQTLKQARKEVEERNLKLAVLEQHFISLNTVKDEDIDMIENAGLSFDTNDTKEEEENRAGGGRESTGATAGGGDDQQQNDQENASNAPSHKSSSIIRLDKSYLIDLKKSLNDTKIELEKLKQENAEKNMVKNEMMRQLEDLSERLRCRESTISSLDQTLKQMRASRFKQKSASRKGHKRRSTMNDMAEAIPEEPARPSTAPINDNNTTISITEDVIAEAVNEALNIKTKEHEVDLKILQDKIETKDTLIKKLKLQNSSMKRMNSSMALSRRNMSMRNLGNVSSVASMMRNMTLTNEIMNTFAHRLEGILTKVDQMLDPELKRNIEMGIDLPDELAPIRKLASRMSLVNAEMKMSMKLIEQSVRNDLLRMKNGFDRPEAYASMERPKSAGQVTSSEDSCLKESLPNSSKSLQREIQREKQVEELDNIQARMNKMIQEVETGMAKDIKEIKYQIQNVEVEMESKQDMIEALELACSEHDRNCRSLQEQMSALVMRLEERADQEPGDEQ